MSKQDSKIKGEIEEQRELPITFLTSLIPIFDGVNTDLHKFNKSCDYAYELSSEYQKPIIYKYILTKIQGKADAIVSCRNLTDWTGCRQFLIENFQKTKAFSQLLLDLQTCKQHKNESIMEFTQRIDKNYSNLTRAANAETINSEELVGKHALIKQMTLQAFVLGVLPQYSYILRARDPSSFEEASQLAVNEEKLQNSSFNRFSGYTDNNRSLFCNKCKTRGHSADNCRRDTKNNFNDDKKYLFCSYCKIKGHSIESCRKNPKNIFKAEVSDNAKKIICFFCNKPGHIKAKCYKYKESLNLKTSPPTVDAKKVHHIKTDQF